MKHRRCAHAWLANAVLAATGWFPAGVSQAQAIATQWHGYAEMRAGHAAGDDRSWLDGGLGKGRFGKGSGDLRPSAALAMAWQLAPAWLVSTELQYQDGQQIGRAHV